MRILVCVKRVPLTGGKMVLTADEQAIEALVDAHERAHALGIGGGEQERHRPALGEPEERRPRRAGR
jgi:hypothetical protein